MPGIFDLGALPLANFALVKFSDHEFALLHQEHHIVHDGWGGSEFTAELMNWYHSFVSPEFKFQPSPVPQYADFVITQKNWMKSDLAAQQRNYWVEQLKDAPQSVSIFGKKNQSIWGLRADMSASTSRALSGQNVSKFVAKWALRLLALQRPFSI